MPVRCDAEPMLCRLRLTLPDGAVKCIGEGDALALIAALTGGLQQMRAAQGQVRDFGATGFGALAGAGR